jgi:hypothetical protein
MWASKFIPVDPLTRFVCILTLGHDGLCDLLLSMRLYIATRNRVDFSNVIFVSYSLYP